METTDRIKKAYIDYVLTEGVQPKSVYIFTNKQKITEGEFYNLFGSFDALEKNIWTDFGRITIEAIVAQDVWGGYSAREQILSFFYSFFEQLKSNRSFAVYSLKDLQKGLTTPTVLTGLKELFENFSSAILTSGIESGELLDRKFVSERYKDALWLQFAFVLHFWINDDSAGFERTDEAIEKGLNVTFDLFERSPIDNLFEYGKFLMKHSRLKPPIGFSGF